MSLAPKPFAALGEGPSCARCGKPEVICVCALLTPLATKHRLLVLQHPQEGDHLLGTVPLLQAGLRDVTVRCGLSWSSLTHALGDASRTPATSADYALVFPLTGVVPQEPAALYDVRGSRLRRPATRLRGAILLDGTWSQAKTLLWRNPWLRKLPRLVLHPAQPSIYGRLRREPRAGLCSTLEAAVWSLAAMGENEATVGRPLLKALRTMAQRLRDA